MEHYEHMIYGLSTILMPYAVNINELDYSLFQVWGHRERSAGAQLRGLFGSVHRDEKLMNTESRAQWFPCSFNYLSLPNGNSVTDTTVLLNTAELQILNRPMS